MQAPDIVVLWSCCLSLLLLLLLVIVALISSRFFVAFAHLFVERGSVVSAFELSVVLLRDGKSHLFALVALLVIELRQRVVKRLVEIGRASCRERV